MSEEQSSPKTTGKSSRMNPWCCWGPIGFFVLIIIIFVVVNIIPRDFSKKSPARNYQYPNPSTEALNRNLNCDDFPIFKTNPGKYKPVCLNLYKTSPQEINSLAQSGQYNRLLVYGENASFDITVPTTIRNVDNLGEALYNKAKFNDLITIPKEMSAYGLDNLNFISKEFMPYPSMYYQFASQDEIKDRCHAYVGGCAIFSFGTIVKDSFLAPNKDWGTLSNRTDDPNSDTIQYDYQWPTDCYADTTMMHELGHNFLVANKITFNGMNTSGWLKAPSYFNENLTEIFTTEFSDTVCGAGTAKITKDVINGQNVTGGIVEFNGVFPPAMLHPTSFPKDNTCEQAIISTYSHYLAKGDFQTQFTKFVTTFRQAMANNAYAYFDDDKRMANFMLQMLDNDPTEKNFLNEHGCNI